MESDGVDQDSVPDVQGRPHSKRDVALAAEEAFAINGQYPNVPQQFMNYISDRRLCTQKIYRHDIEQFLGFVERETKQPARLEEVWNWNLCHRFLKIVKATKAEIRGSSAAGKHAKARATGAAGKHAKACGSRTMKVD